MTHLEGLYYQQISMLNVYGFDKNDLTRPLIQSKTIVETLFEIDFNI